MAVVKLPGKMDIAVLISGRGSNLQSIIEACENPDFPARVSVVISNRPDVFGLDRAQKASIPAITIDHKHYGGKADFEAALHNAIADYDVDLICLAGFMRLLSADFIAKWPDKIINIHPSLLPKHKGLDTHRRAIEAGDSVSGCTVHYVVPEMDSGRILVQKETPILGDDTPETLAARILDLEHLAYPEAIKIFKKERRKKAAAP